MRFGIILLGFFLCWAHGMSFPDVRGQELVANKSRMDFLRQKPSELLLGDLKLTLDYVANVDQDCPRILKQVALENSKSLGSKIDEMPVWMLNEFELQIVAQNISESTGKDSRKVQEKLKAQLKAHYKKLQPGCIHDLESQWRLANRILRDIESETDAKIIKRLFYWRVIRSSGIELLLRKQQFVELTGITSEEIEKVKVGISEQRNTIRKLRIENNRKVIKAVLGELTNSQLKTFSQRMGIHKDSIPHVFDFCSEGALKYHLQNRVKNFRFCVVPYHYQQGHYFMPPRTIGISPCKALEKSIKKWKYSSVSRPQHHAVEVEAPGRDVDRAIKSEFQSTFRPKFVDVDLFMLSPHLFGKMQNTDGKFMESYSMNDPKKGDLKVAISDWTNDQIKQFYETSYVASSSMVAAKSAEEVCQIYSDWAKNVGKILLPEQAVYIYQRNVARNGLVFFLMRPDVATELRISDTQKDKILKIAKQEHDKLEPFEMSLKLKGISGVLQVIPLKKRRRLAELLGVKEQRFAKFLISLEKGDIFSLIAADKYNYQPRKQASLVW